MGAIHQTTRTKTRNRTPAERGSNRLKAVVGVQCEIGTEEAGGGTEGASKRR